MSKGNDREILSSEWLGLSPHLIASFYEVRKDGAGSWRYIDGECDKAIVQAPLTEANMEVPLNWQSPFENAGPETKAPALSAMLQSGALQTVVDAVAGATGLDAAKAAAEKSRNFMKQFEGRTGITRLNSTQVFSGMPPIKITMNAVFRAWADTQEEVERPADKLMEWALPVELAGDSTLLSRAAQSAGGDMGWIEAMMPSKSPVKIAMLYKGRTYSPLVIESKGKPISSNVDAWGRYVELLIPMTLCSLTAIDRKDWAASRRFEI